MKTLILGLALLLDQVQAGELIITNRFEDIAGAAAHTVGEKPGEALLIFDIDNTILRNVTDLGSEHWFLWQRGLLESGAQGLPLVATSMANLFFIQGMIFNVAPMSPVSPEIPAFMNEMRTRGARVISLTSRGFGNREGTLRELRNNRMPLSSAEELGLPAAFQPALPYDPQHPDLAGLTEEDIRLYNLSSPRPVAFDGGVFFTEGQHKGIMLKILLHKLSHRYSSILFVDDRMSHIEGMRAVFSQRPEKMTTVNYTRSLEWVDAFNAGDKEEVRMQWCSLSHGLAQSLYAGPGPLPFRSCP